MAPGPIGHVDTSAVNTNEFGVFLWNKFRPSGRTQFSESLLLDLEVIYVIVKEGPKISCRRLQGDL